MNIWANDTTMYKTKKEETALCLECGKAIYGRKDKHFCDLGCKNRYWNRQVQEQRRIRMETIGALTRNYAILDALIKDECNSIELEELERLGYDASVVTGHRKGRNRHDEYACFDICFYRSRTRIFNLRRRACVLR